jgi:hypothetical protein
VTPLTHHDVEELLGAYAVDAVDADEAVMIEAHLAECPRCRAEVADLREVAALLANSGTSAPAGVWERIAAELDDAPPPMRLFVNPTAGVVALDRARHRWRRFAVAGVAAAAAVVILVLGISVRTLNHKVDHLQATNATETAAGAALGDPSARLARLKGDAGQTALAVLRPNGEGYFIANGLAPLDHRVYELWGATSAGQVVALGTMPGPGVYAFSADASVTVVMVTAEDHAVPAPTSPAIATGPLV